MAMKPETVKYELFYLFLNRKQLKRTWLAKNALISQLLLLPSITYYYQHNYRLMSYHST